MSTRRSRNRLVLAVSLLLAGGALAFLAFGGIGENLVYYWNPSEVLAAGEKAVGATIRLGGQVVPGSLHWDPERRELRFRLTDGEHELPVLAHQAPPEMLREGIGALVEGTLGPDGVFQAERVLVKHSNEYRAPVDGKHPGDVYRTVEGL